MTLYNFLMLLGIVLFFLTAISTFCFFRISGKFLEREMKKEGILPPDWDSLMGLRYCWYAFAIIRNSVSPVSMVNDEAVLRLARKKDWYLAIFYLVTLYSFMAVAAIAYFLYAP
ncbi:hypothetical protein SG34_008745 [Thalassomonas viridans]|uniref:Uncharacterized protein n=1 Tax=Thalassomonas viridans TaxID=137584 RepID=A0AAF0CBY1_9GAMM|nr:hypothetical protein [Thalassomonas viridans]WDE06959.1 hypothetical protein SG34_008745 [Thalassomonas viridans]